MTRAVLAPRAATAWQYVDEARTHALAAAVLRDRVVVREWALQAKGAAGGLAEQVFALTAPWEARLTLWTLEARLALLGAYWRRAHGSGGWARIAAPRGAPVPDLRPAQVVPGVLLHHYHDPRGRLDEVVAAMPAGGRYHVVRAELELPTLDVGRIRLLHEGVAEPLMRSALVHEQVARVHEARPKLVTRGDYERALGEDGPERVVEAVRCLSQRMVGGEWERPAAPAEESDVLGAFLGVVNDPRLLALHARFLTSAQEEELLAGGPPAIRRYLASRRQTTPHHEQHLLTILEASLLARERLRSGQLTQWDPEVRALTRVAFYL